MFSLKIVKKIERKLSNKDLISELLLLEKDRRGVDKDELVFLGTSNISEFWWCSIKSLMKSKRDETMFFTVYLFDRIYYALKLRYIEDIPESKEKLLDVGSEITFNDIDRLLRRKIEHWKAFKDKTIIGYHQLNTNGKKVMVSFNGKRIMINGKVTNSKDFLNTLNDINSKRRGIVLHMIRSKYPTIRWNFPWGKYTIIAMPDGITDTFVYEYKSTKNMFLLYFVKPVAFAQADLYGYFFKREKKIIEIEVCKKGRIFSWKEGINSLNAISTLKNFEKLENNINNAIPPKKWKCNCCEFKNVCPHNL